MNLRSSWVAETGQTREDTRLTQIGATTPANPVQALSGVLPGSHDGRSRLAGFRLEGTAAMSATIHEGRAVIQGQTSQGFYPVTLTSSEVVTFAAGNAQYSRIDLVVLRIYDNLYDKSSNLNEAKIEIIEGTAGPTPKPPAVPALCLPLWKVTVVAGASAGNGGINWSTSVEDLRNSVVAIGGILPVEKTVQPGAYPGQYQDSGGALQRWDGGAWVPYPSALGGIVPSSASTLIASYTGQYRDTAGGQLQRWNGSAWVPAVPGPYFNDSLDSGYTVSTTYGTALTGRTTLLTLTFTAPASKAVILTFGSKITLVGTNLAGSGLMSLRITKGTEVYRDITTDDYAVVGSTSTAATGAVSTSTTQRLSNLTPGASYTLTPHYKTTNTSLKAHFDNCFIRVDPQA
ncbi:hypothetical protein GCM10020367_37540 [Streptomyces sannanensis]|uniref:Minor tail protein n=1 Tax=Streptomyces sannanensis TaxID=285536 RepID=A0ABP6SEM9_9ACTN